MDSTIQPGRSVPTAKSLRANFSWIAIGNILYAACQWAVITVLAKLGTPSMVGQFALAVAITSPVYQLLNLQLRGVQATDAKREFRFSDYCLLRALTTSLAVVVIAGIGLFGGYSWGTFSIILLVGIAKACDAISDVYYGLFQQHEQMDIIAKALIWNGATSLVMMIGGMLVGGLLVGAIGYVFGSLIPLVAYIVPRAKQRGIVDGGDRLLLELPARSASLLRLARMSLPLGIVMLMISLNTNIPRYFIEAYLGEQALGIFAALAYLIVAGGTIVSALGQAASPRLSQFYALRQMEAFRRVLLGLMGLGMGLGLLGAVVAMLAGAEIVTLLYTSEYAEYRDVLVILALAAGFAFAASIVGYGMTAVRSFQAQVPVNSIVLITALVASPLLIGHYGLVGASLSLLVTAAVQLALSSVVLLRAVRRVGDEAT